MTPDELTFKHAQANQPWVVPYSAGVQAAANGVVPHILGSHTVLHAAKSLGKLASAFEGMDHGKPCHVDEVLLIGEMSADLVTAALRLCNLYGIDLSRVFVERVEEKNGINILHTGS